MDLNDSWQQKKCVQDLEDGSEVAAILLWRLAKDTCCHRVSGTLSLTCWVTLLVWAAPKPTGPQLIPDFLFHRFQFWSRHGVCRKMTRWQLLSSRLAFTLMGCGLSSWVIMCPRSPPLHIQRFTDVLPSSYFRLTLRWTGKSLPYKCVACSHNYGKADYNNIA